MAQHPEDIIVKTSPINGRGVFAARSFQKGEVVMRWKSRQLSEAEYAALPETERNYIEIQNSKILLMGEPERYVNHSCCANTNPGELCDLASRDIKMEEEITADYSNFSIPEGRFTCNCGSPKCRGVIVGQK